MSRPNKYHPNPNYQHQPPEYPEGHVEREPRPPVGMSRRRPRKRSTHQVQTKWGAPVGIALGYRKPFEVFKPNEVRQTAHYTHALPWQSKAKRRGGFTKNMRRLRRKLGTVRS